MKRFNQMIIGVLLLMVLIFFAANYYMHNLQTVDRNRPYQVEINRLQWEIKESGFSSINLDRYNYIRNIETLTDNTSEVEKENFFHGSNLDYTIMFHDGVFYRFDYENLGNQNIEIIAAINIGIILMTVLIVSILIFVRLKLMKPFNEIKDMPYELSKGNLTGGIKESKSRFFGKFIWGINLLRENLEEQKIKELSLQKEKKALILSISHDIKTPLSAIKLYSKALSRNLYDTEEKKREIAENIGARADEIEAFVGDIIKASEHDFLNIQVENSEFYLEQLLKKTREYYSEKLTLLKTEFEVEKFDNCLIHGDLNRAVEVIQNVIENAIKYGDGTKIHISSRNEEDCKLVTVTNTGCTLPPSELPYIFDSFWRGSNVKNKGGSGLGLYICRQILRKMDGDIFAECVGTDMHVTVVLKMS